MKGVATESTEERICGLKEEEYKGDPGKEILRPQQAVRCPTHKDENTS
jgi:hypothetical protein